MRRASHSDSINSISSSTSSTTICRRHTASDGNSRNYISPSFKTTNNYSSPHSRFFEDTNKSKGFRSHRPTKVEVNNTYHTSSKEESSNVQRSPIISNKYRPKVEAFNTAYLSSPCSANSQECTSNHRWIKHTSIIEFLLIGITVFLNFIGILSIFHLLNSNGNDKSVILSSSSVLNKDLDELSRQLQESQKHLNKLEIRKKELNEKIINVQKTSNSIRKKLGQNKFEKYTENELLSKLQQLQLRVEQVSKEEVLRRFGVGPYYVQVDLRLPQSVFPDTQESSIILQMAPLEYQPSSIYTFLDQVENNVWSRETNATIYRNAPHVIQAHSDASLNGDKMPFHELAHDNFKHEMYSVGYTGMGRTWFINLKPENVEIHKKLPCFAKVLFGSELIWKIHESMQTISDSNNREYMVEPIQIANAFVVNDM